MNYNGKVTAANMQTFVGGDNQEKHYGETTNVINGPYDETALMFAPVHSHSIMQTGRACNDCHGTATVQEIYEDGELAIVKPSQ